MVRIETPWTADLIHFQMDKRVLAKPLVRSWGGQLINWMRLSKWRHLKGTYCYRVHSHDDGTEHKAWLQLQLKGPHGTEAGGRKQSGPC